MQVGTKMSAKVSVTGKSGLGRSNTPGHLFITRGANHLMVHVAEHGVKWMNADAILGKSCKTIAFLNKTTENAKGPLASPQYR